MATVMRRMTLGGRMPLCGLISGYNDGTAAIWRLLTDPNAAAGVAAQVSSILPPVGRRPHPSSFDGSAKAN